jgi:hypothetical protein
MIAYRIKIVQDTASPAVQALQVAFRPNEINPLIGRAAAEATRQHYIELNRDRPNALGGARTNYYLGAARGTSFTVYDDGVIISIRQIGIALRYYGGTVTAGKGVSALTGKPTRFLTIPVNPRAHGHRASEFDLEVVYNHNGVPVALATKSTLGVALKQSKGGKVLKRAIGRRGEIMFLLKRSVTQQADPSVLPQPDRIYGAVISSVNAYTDRILGRAGDAAKP